MDQFLINEIPGRAISQAASFYGKKVKPIDFDNQLIKNKSQNRPAEIIIEINKGFKNNALQDDQEFKKPDCEFNKKNNHAF